MDVRRSGKCGEAGVVKERGNGFGNWTRLFLPPFLACVENDDEEEDCKKRKYWKGREGRRVRDR